MRLGAEPAAYRPPVEPGMDLSDRDRLSQVRQSTLVGPNNSLSWELDGYQFELRGEPLQLVISNNGASLLETLPGRFFWVDGNQRRRHYHVKPEDGLYYGLGEKSGPLLRNHRAFDLNNRDAIGYHPEFGDPLYKHIPFYLMHRPTLGHSLGIFLNNAYPSRFDFGSERSGYWSPYTSMVIDGGDLDLYFLMGPTPGDVLKRYYRLTGFPAMPTKASLGYLGSTMYYTELPADADQAVLGFIRRCHALDIPISGFHLSSGYTKGQDGKRYTLTWNQTVVSDPARFVEEMAAEGQILSPNIKPGMLTTHPLYAEFDQIGGFLQTAEGETLVEKYWGGQASFVDFSNPKARALWRRYLVDRLIQLGVSAIWNDNNEFEIDDDQVIANNDGRPVDALALKPRLANEMARVAFEALSEEGTVRPFVLSRAGYAGLQKYAQTWSGDNSSTWDDFHFNVATMLGMSLSGMPFNGMDIGGFAGPAPEPALFLRWVQNGIFHPRFSIHSVNSDNTVTEPWLYPDLLPQIRRAIRTRYLFLPTLYTLGRSAHHLGTPIVAPLIYHFPDDPACQNMHTAFMLGEGLLVVALTRPGLTTLEVYFPAGEWTCFYTGTGYQGGQSYLIELSDAYAPLFYRSGYGFLLDSSFFDAVEGVTPIEPEKESLIAWLDVRDEGRMGLYDDDGKSLDYLNGDVLTASFAWSQRDDGRLTLTYLMSGSFEPSYQALYLFLAADSITPFEIKRGGVTLAQTLYHDHLETDHWYFDAARRIVVVQLAGDLLRGPFELILDYRRMINIDEENE